MAEDQTTGTQTQEGGDAAQPTTGTPGGEGRDAESKEPDYKQLYLESKGKIEEANQLKQRVAELESRQPSPAAATPENDAYWAEVKDWAAKGDATSKGVLALTQAITTMNELRRMRLSPEEEEEVMSLFIKENHRFGSDIGLAHTAIRESKLARENEQLRKELEIQKERRNPDVLKAPATGAGRDVSAGELKTRTMTEDQFDDEAKRIFETQGELAMLKFQARAGKDIQFKR